MRLLRISEKQKEYYEDLIFTEFRDLLYRDEMICFGLVDGGNDSASPVGLLILSVAEDALAIEWMYVDEEHQGQGYGDYMLEYVFGLARMQEIKYVDAKLRADKGDEADESSMSLLYDMRDWFSERGFEWNISDKYEFAFYFDSLKESVKKGSSNGADDIKSFEELPDAIVKGYMKHVSEDMGEVYAGAFDKKSAVAYLVSGRIMAAITARRYGNIYVPLEFYLEGGSVDKQVLTRMIYEFIRIAYKAVHDDGILNISCDKQSPLTVLNNLFGYEHLVETETYRCSVEEDSNDLIRIRSEKEQSEAATAKAADIPKEFEVIGVEYYSGAGIKE